MTDTFWNSVEVGTEAECWPWRRGLRQGYGTYWNGHKIVAAHRHSVLLEGRDLPAGMVVDHTCRNRACVNPAHLRVVDRRTNALENSVGHAAKNAAKDCCPKGHPYEGENLVKVGTARKCKTCLAANARNSYWGKQGVAPPPLPAVNTRLPLSDETVAQVRAAEGSSRVIAARFGISQSHVVRLRNGTRGQADITIARNNE